MYPLFYPNLWHGVAFPDRTKFSMGYRGESFVLSQAREIVLVAFSPSRLVSRARTKEEEEEEEEEEDYSLTEPASGSRSKFIVSFRFVSFIGSFSTTEQSRLTPKSRDAI